MRYLITGGAGFIGSHLADHLIGLGHEVFVIDDLSTGSMDNIRHLKGCPRFHYDIDTIANAPLLAELVDTCDAVFHLAAAVGVRLVVEQPVHTIETNIHGTGWVLSAAQKKKKPVLVASSSEVYGKSTAVPFCEDDDMVLGPSVKARWSYACSKAIDEFLALAYHRERGLPTVVARLFNTVGPRQTGRYGMVIPTFVRQALAGEPITVYGDGEQTRCFTHVKDVVRALFLLLGRSECHGRVFNVGSDQEISILELAERVKKAVGVSTEIRFVPYDEAYTEGFEDMRRRVPNVARIGRLGWKASGSLDEIVADVVDHERKGRELLRGGVGV
ncbi:MAG: GDP-mannose 4,6-dehydratase [Polyangia bacterium]|jgi:UDP-glucose 4-epimerase|nr:GDP-mannose 4,6-dehydratase [Polyangia bacterium]